MDVIFSIEENTIERSRGQISAMEDILGILSKSTELENFRFKVLSSLCSRPSIDNAFKRPFERDLGAMQFWSVREFVRHGEDAKQHELDFAKKFVQFLKTAVASY